MTKNHTSKKNLHGMQPDTPYSLDSLFHGAMYCKQYKEGYRFSLDAVLAAHFPLIKKGDSVLDLGCGSGIIGLILMFRWKQLLLSVSGLEVQSSLVRLARENTILNGFEEMFTIVEGDLCEIEKHFPAESFSKVICNPPFYKTSNGRGNVNQEAYVARHQVLAKIETIIEASRYCVKNKGCVTIIYPADGLADLVHILRQNRLEPKRIQPIYSRQDDELARLVLVDAVKNGGLGIVVMKPFYIYRDEGDTYSDAMQKLYDI